MIINLTRTILELGNYLTRIRYPRSRIALYIVVSIVIGVLLSNSPGAVELPILTVVAILFGFTINAVVMLGNNSDHYLSSDSKYSDQLVIYYEKALYMSIHTLGIGIVTIIVAGVYQLFPDVGILVIESQVLGHLIDIELISVTVFSLTTYYLMTFTIVIASAAELVKIRINT